MIAISVLITWQKLIGRVGKAFLMYREDDISCSIYSINDLETTDSSAVKEISFRNDDCIPYNESKRVPKIFTLKELNDVVKDLQ